jgi:hypothetical protein
LILVSREFKGIFSELHVAAGNLETMEKLLKLAEVVPVPPFFGSILEAEIVLLFDTLGFNLFGVL